MNGRNIQSTSYRAALKSDVLRDHRCKRRQRDVDAAEFYMGTGTKV